VIGCSTNSWLMFQKFSGMSSQGTRAKSTLVLVQKWDFSSKEYVPLVWKFVSRLTGRDQFHPQHQYGSLSARQPPSSSLVLKGVDK